MDEQTAVLVEDHGEWVLVTDDESETHVWKALDTAMEELLSDGWQVVQGPVLDRLSEPPVCPNPPKVLQSKHSRFLIFAASRRAFFC